MGQKVFESNSLTEEDVVNFKMDYEELFYGPENLKFMKPLGKLLNFF
jgi:hypothetical protein